MTTRLVPISAWTVVMATALLSAVCDAARSTPPESFSSLRNIWMSSVLWDDKDATRVYVKAIPLRCS